LRPAALRSIPFRASTVPSPERFPRVRKAKWAVVNLRGSAAQLVAMIEAGTGRSDQASGREWLHHRPRTPSPG